MDRPGGSRGGFRTTSPEEYEQVHRILQSIKPIDSLDKEDELPLINAAKQGDQAAMQTLIQAYIAMILKIASERGSSTVPLPDRVQDGIEGLIDAVRRYNDPSGQTPLMAFAKWRVLMHVQREERSYRERPSDPDEGPELGDDEPEFASVESHADVRQGTVRRILEQLNEDEQIVLTALYLEPPPTASIEELAAVLNKTPEEVERIRGSGLAKARDLWVQPGSTTGGESLEYGTSQHGVFTVVPIADVKVGERIRQDFGRLSDLAESINRQGLLQPITLTKDGWLVAGHRRLLACRDILRWTEIPAHVMPWSSADEPRVVEEEVAHGVTA